MKKWLLTVAGGIIITPILALSWGNLTSLWATPQKVEEVSKTVQKQGETQDQISKLILEQHNRLEKEEAVYAAQMDSVQKQLELIAELKKK